MLQIVVVISVLSAVEVNEVNEVVKEAPNTVVWIQPMSGWFGRTSLGVERAVSPRLSVLADVYGGYFSMRMNWVNQPDLQLAQDIMEAGGTLGLRFFPSANAPAGFWLGLHVRGGWGRVHTVDTSFDVFQGNSTVQAGWTHVFESGIAVQGALGATAAYQRMIGDVRGSGVAFFPTLWLGVGYAF